MHQSVGPDNLPAVDVTDALVAEADAENREALAKGPDDIITDPCLARGAGPGGDDDPLRSQFLDFFNRDLVVATHLQIGT